MKKLKILFLLIICLSVMVIPNTGMAAIIDIMKSSINSGEKIHIKMVSNSDQPFAGNVLIYKDTFNTNIPISDWKSETKFSSLSISLEQDKVETGTPFKITMDTLNYPPGHYYFIAPLTGQSEYVYDDIQILPMSDVVPGMIRQDMISNNRTCALYAEDGSLIRRNKWDPGYVQEIPKVSPDKIVILALNLNVINKIRSISVQHDIVKIQSLKLKKEMEFKDAVILTPECGTPNLSASEYPDGIALIYHRTPAHMKYYENDVELRYSINMSREPVDEDICYMYHEGWTIQLDDDPKLPPLPHYRIYVGQNFPGKPYMINYPFDVRRATIVRIGNARLSTKFKLFKIKTFLEKKFKEATKGYFKLIVDHVYQYPLVNDYNKKFIKDWYEKQPETPGKNKLNLDDPHQLYLAGLCYYSQVSGSEYINDDSLVYMLQQIYPLQSSNEDITIYLYDSSAGPRGQILGGKGLRVKVTELLSTEVLFKNTNGTITYHFDPTLCTDCNGAATAKEFIKYLASSGSTTQTLNTTLHELGHAYWMDRADINLQHPGPHYSPVINNTFYIDNSMAYFARFEYMSNLRDLYSFAGMSYGDENLEKILAAYAQPETEIKFISHPEVGYKTISVNSGEEIRFNLMGRAKSGLNILWYKNQSAPVELSYKSPEKSGIIIFNPLEKPVKIKTLKAKIILKSPGKYVYGYYARSRLNGVKGHNHQSGGRFKIFVK